MTIREKRTTFEVHGDQICATIVAPQTLLPGILFVHGWGGSQVRYLERAREIAELGCVCLTFDLTGHVGTATRFATVTRDNNLQDVLAAYDLLVSQPNVDPGQIAVVGSSYGGYLAALLTALRPVQWLALRVPALYVDTGWEVPKLQLRKEQDLDAYRQTIIAAEKNRALLACSQFAGDVLLVQSETDHLIPPAVISNYREACVHARSLTYRMMRGADHGLTEEPMRQVYTALLFNWLREMVFGAQRAAALAPAAPSVAAARG